ncbi:MAG: hypothetical protein V3R78_12505 [Thermodesulfobacteriota bacterium]
MTIQEAPFAIVFILFAIAVIAIGYRIALENHNNMMRIKCVAMSVSQPLDEMSYIRACTEKLKELK